ncbi:F-box/kelch-repeat protein At3g23880-like [Cornus florida]|uniref:F-box/kelch-repeat protein At3g23880-like n=1 Tax=Cornus florida TaxID=4283 RepID=UPI002896B40C|nr:F-box/kelch-repeat protein At3g23880-like [Cornus florida]
MAESHGICGLVAKWFMKFFQPLPILPHDIIYDILLLQPINSVGRFRCVCREWNNLLTRSDFIKKHVLKASGKHRLIVSSLEYHVSRDLEAPYNIVMTKLEFPWKEHVHEIMGSCNGLLCVFVDHNYLFLWNPTTRVYKQLPPPPSWLEKPIYHPLFYGFGYNISIDGCYNYKVVIGGHGIKSSIVEVYCQKTSSWRRIQDFPCLNTLQARGTFVNGFLHWLGFVGRGNGYSNNYCHNIVFLDLAKEEFGEVLVPNFENPYVLLGLGVLNGMLCVMCSHSSGWEICAMKEYGVPESWIALITIPYRLWTTVQMSAPFYWMNTGELVMQRDDEMMVVYDPRKKSFKKLIDSKSRIESTTYVESLESP